MAAPIGVFVVLNTGPEADRRPDGVAVIPLPYSFNRQFVYRWVGHRDGGWDMKRILPDPVYDCGAGNIPTGAKTLCDRRE